MPPTNGEPHPPFNVPANNSGHGNVLKIGRGVSVYYDLQPPNLWTEHEHSTAQIVIALDPPDAHLTWRIAGRLHSVDSGVPHVWFVPRNTPHTAEWRCGPSAMVVFYLAHEFVLQECGHEPADGALLGLAPLVQQDYGLCRFCHNFRELCHRRSSMSEPMIFAGAAVLSSVILRACVRQADTGADQPRGLSEKRLAIISDYIDAHLGDPITPAILAALVGLSEDHFGRMFRRSTGHSPMKYVWRCRLHRARQLLEAGEKVAAVAAELGFCDQSHLDRKFREEFRCSPGSVAPGRNRP